MNSKKIIGDLVSLKSYDNNNKIIKYLIKKFKPFSKEIVKIHTDKNNRYNLVIGINTKLNNVEALILSGHIDTVPADKNYTVNPFSLKIVDGKAFGLGIIDMKCYFASILENIETIKKLKIPTIVCITCDEETDLQGIEKICQFLKSNNIQPRYTIIGEPTGLNICTSNKGCYEYSITIKGKSCHSCNPALGINACYIMAKIIDRLEYLSSVYPNTTVNCGIVEGGSAINIVPDSSCIKFDIRSTSAKYINLILKDLQKQFKQLEGQYSGSEIKMLNTLIIPEFERKKDALIRKFCDENKLTETEFMAASEAGYFQKFGGEVVIFGAGDLSLAHKADEYLILEDYETYNKLFVGLLGKINQKYISRNA